MVDIAIIGIGCVTPSGVGKRQFWRSILNNVSHFKTIPSDRWLVDDYYDADPSAEDKVYCKRGAFIPEVPFNPLEFAIPPKNIEATDTTQLLALIAAKEALGDTMASDDTTPLDLSRASVILGATSAQELLVSMGARLQRPIWRKALKGLGLADEACDTVCQHIANQYVSWQENTFPGVLGNVVAGRLANYFNFGGTNCITDAACASSFSALSMAVNELVAGQSDLVVTGGADTFNDIFMYSCFAKTTALSVAGHCLPFSEEADGTLLGEAVCLFALKRLDDAERDNDKIYAVIKGVGSSSDGRSKSIYAPVAAGQVQALKRSYEQAGYAPSTVGCIEAHGTGTTAGDNVELDALHQVFSTHGTAHSIALGSIKSQIGHTKASAGAVGLFKMVMALRDKVLPPTRVGKSLHPQMTTANTPFYLNTKARPWIHAASQPPRRAGVSSFGFGGTNFHISLEEYTHPEHVHGRLRIFEQELLLISASNKNEAIAQIKALLEDSREPLAIVADSHPLFSTEDHYRLAFIVEMTQAFKPQLEELLETLHHDKPDQRLMQNEGVLQGKTAVVFTGQGSQKLGMGQTLAQSFDCVRQIWDTSAECHHWDQKALHEWVYPNSAPGTDESSLRDGLTQPPIAQPALAVLGASHWALLKRLGLTVDYFAGHSFGEYIAHYAAGRYDLKQLIDIAFHRGKIASTQAQADGRMLAIFASQDTVESLIAGKEDEYTLANSNSSKQCVVSTAESALAALQKQCDEKGIASAVLPVNVAYHSRLCQGMVAPFAEHLSTQAFATADNNVINNQGAVIDASMPEEQLKHYLASHCTEPVLFTQQIQNLHKQGVRHFIEVGSGAVLTPFITDILAHDPQVTAVAMADKQHTPLAALWRVIGQCCVSGIRLNLNALWDEFDLRDEYQPAGNPLANVMINGGNVNRPYPPGNFSELSDVITVAPTPTPVPAQETTNTLDDAAQRLAAIYEEHKTALEKEFQGLIQQQVAEPVTPPVTPESQEAYVIADLPQSLTTTPITQDIPRPKPQEPVPEPVPEPAPEPVPEPVAAEPETSTRFRDSLIAIIAEKTGFDTAIINDAMSLEVDLGIDSIKRVEIMAAFRQQHPDIELGDAQELAALNTIADVVEHVQQKDEKPAPAIHPSATVETIASSPAATATAPADDQLMRQLIDVIAEKTGFDAGIIQPIMSLEVDLGVDSIKRVEILAALRQQHPDIALGDAQDMASLNTLEDIIQYIHSRSPSTLKEKKK